jgi:UDP-N-acetyl-D-glucosamine dehydrogenase
MKIVVIGQGYVGLPLAMAFAEAGHNVIGLDKSQNLVHALNSGVSHVEDVPNQRIKDAILSKKYEATSDEVSLKDCDVAIIAVPTPLDEDRNPDISYVEAASHAIGQNIQKPILVVNESTSYPGTLRDVIARIVEDQSQVLDCNFAVSPERVDPGNKVWKISNTPRLIAGLTPHATKLVKDLYGSICSELIVVDKPEVAEVAKLFENTFRQVNIALVNELALITQTLSIAVNDVLEAANTKPYGFMRFNPSLGVGGHCIPVDPSYLAYSAKTNGIEPKFINLANEINLSMPSEVVKRIKKDFGGSLKNLKVLICGISYKSDISDLRESPSIELRQLLISEGALVSWHDPLVGQYEKQTSHTPKAAEFDISIIAQLHSVMNLESIRNSSKYIFDCTGKVEGANTF